jgi:hypothetical protein
LGGLCRTVHFACNMLAGLVGGITHRAMGGFLGFAYKICGVAACLVSQISSMGHCFGLSVIRSWCSNAPARWLVPKHKTKRPDCRSSQAVEMPGQIGCLLVAGQEL